MSAAERTTSAAAALARWLGPRLGRVWPSGAAVLAERTAAADRLETWGRSRPAGPLVWLHGASAGELLGAAPAIRALRRQIDVQLVVTHSSPSGVAALPHLEADHAGFPPLDSRSDCQRALAGVHPSALVYARADVWPGLTGAAARACVPVGMINAIVRPGSRRMGPLARVLMRSTYARLSLVGASSKEDAERLERLGVRREALRVTGDAGFDLALSRADRARDESKTREWFEARLPLRAPGAVRLVAGSTWPADEDALLDALDALGERRRLIQLVIVPHQPTESHLAQLLDACERRGRRCVRWSEMDRDRPPPATREESGRAAGAGMESVAEVVAFDEVGTLAELYTVADLAYVGGGLGRSGLHNVVEPAAAGIPVLFGPRYDRRDATELVAGGGGFEVTPASLAGMIDELLDPGTRGRIGARARSCVDSRRGGARAGAGLMLELIEGGQRE